MRYSPTLIQASLCTSLYSSYLIINSRVTAFAPVLTFTSHVHQSSSRRFSAVINDTNNPPTIPSPPPIDNTPKLKLPELFPSLAACLSKLGFSTPTPIQSASATQALDLENLLLIAPTGSGKTLAYLLPALEKTVSQRGAGTILIVAPTRELAAQLFRDTTSILSNLDGLEDLSALLAVKGLNMPTSEQLDNATVLIGTPPEIVRALTEQGGQSFIAGDVISSVILDEVDVLLPNAPKGLRTALDGDGNARNGKRSNSRKSSPRQDRREQEQKRKLMAAKRKGIEMSSTNKQIVTPTDMILKFIASRQSAGGKDATPCQIIAGSATASRRTLNRLNKALYDAAIEASSTVDIVWAGSAKSCRPDPGVSEAVDGEGEVNNLPVGDEHHTIRAVTVPQQVKHQFIALDKVSASSPTVILSAVAKAAEILKPQTALVFLCGEFGKPKVLVAPAKAVIPSGKRSNQARKKGVSLKNKKMAAAAASRAKNAPVGLSARQACSTLGKLGIQATPLHVALGLELNSKDDDEDAEVPPFLVTFEGSARGLHIDNVDAVFVVGRPASSASYLHLAGRVGRSSAENGDVVIRPGTVVSLCTKGSAIELNKWTKQVGGTDLEELIL